MAAKQICLRTGNYLATFQIAFAEYLHRWHNGKM